MTNQNFTGDKKLPMKSLLAGVERKFIDANVSKFPKWIEGYHLTLMTIPLSAGLLLFGYLAGNNLNWLWLSSLMIFLQWFTDSFDGALGRHRDTGIPKWGFYMDHFLDYVFMSAVFLGYGFFLEGISKTLMFILVPAYGALMVSGFLAFAVTGEFKITYMRTGPTEVRLFFILLNIFLVIFGTGFLQVLLPYGFTVFVVSVVFVIYRTGKYIWDIEKKA